jgi:histone H3/H4
VVAGAKKPAAAAGTKKPTVKRPRAVEPDYPLALAAPLMSRNNFRKRLRKHLAATGGLPATVKVRGDASALVQDFMTRHLQLTAYKSSVVAFADGKLTVVGEHFDVVRDVLAVEN